MLRFIYLHYQYIIPFPLPPVSASLESPPEMKGAMFLPTAFYRVPFRADCTDVEHGKKSPQHNVTDCTTAAPKTKKQK